MLKIALCILLISYSYSQTPSPPFWGGNPQYTVDVVMTNDSPVAQWNFTYSYDATIHAERYQHKGPQFDQMCWLGNPPSANKTTDCIIIFSDDGWSYIKYPLINWCCKCENTFHYINYEWMQNGTTYVGTETVNGYQSQHWTKQGQYLNHYYNTVGGLPVKFFQLKRGNPKAWDFNLNSYKKGPVDRSMFAAPCDNLCGGSCGSYRSKQNLVQQ